MIFLVKIILLTKILKDCKFDFIKMNKTVQSLKIQNFLPYEV